MVREDIFGGLRSALIRGYSLKNAMISFYNAGYKKEDIEDAARKLQYQLAGSKELRDLINSGGEKVGSAKPYVIPEKKPSPKNPPQGKPAPVAQETAEARTRKLPILEASEEEKTGKPTRFKELHKQKPEALTSERNRLRASSYAPGTSIRVITIVLVVLLLLLLGMLSSIFIFKNQIIQFFNNLLT